jgi:hypothetical protein
MRLSPRLGIAGIASHIVLVSVFACVDHNLATIRTQLVVNRLAFILHLSPNTDVVPTIVRIRRLLVNVAASAGRAMLAPHARRLVEFLHPEQATTQAASTAVVHRMQTPSEDET